MSDFDIYSNPFRNFWSGIQDYFNGHRDYKQNLIIIFKKKTREKKEKCRLNTQDGKNNHSSSISSLK